VSGRFITFEGGEGAGKTTLIEEVEKWFQERRFAVFRTREPGGTQLGESVRQILLQPATTISPYAELALFLASRAQHVEEKIRPALKEGKIVLCDRFNDSSIAYQGSARELGLENVEKVCTFFSQGLVPELTLYLDIEPEVGLSRILRSKDRIEVEKLTFHQKIREGYHYLANRYPERFYLLDASKKPKEVFQQAVDLIEKVCLKNI
jgi:dTMP kinase